MTLRAPPCRPQVPSRKRSGAGTLTFYEKALAIREDLRARNPQSADYARDLYVSYIKLGDLHRGLGHGEQALEFYQKALAIAEELHERNPQSADFARDLWVSDCRMAQIEEQTGGDKALEWWRKAYAAISEMEQRGTLLPTDEQYLEALREKVS